MQVIQVKIVDRVSERRADLIHLIFDVGIVALPQGNREIQTFDRYGDFETELRYIRRGSVVKVGIEDHKIVHLGI